MNALTHTTHHSGCGRLITNGAAEEFSHNASKVSH